MKFCIECGHPLDGNHGFCTECGSKQHDNQPSSAARANPNPIRKLRRQPMSKRTKWMFWIVGALGVLLIGTHLFLLSYFDPMKDFREMDRAIIEDDMETFMEYIEWNDTSLLDEESFFHFIKHEEWEGVKGQFLNIVEVEEENKHFLSGIIYSNNGERLFNLKRDSVLWFYHTYTFQAVPTRLIVSANMEGAEVSIDGITHTLETLEPKELMWVYPGSYSIQAYTNNFFGEFIYENELNIYPGEQYEYLIGFLGSTYPFSTNKLDGYLFVNGENTGKTFAELDYLGPVPDGVNPEMHGEWENTSGEVVQTDVLTLADSESSGLDFYFMEDEPEITEAAEEVVEDAGSKEKETEESDSEYGREFGRYLASIVMNFRDAYEVALNTKDFSLIADYLQPDSIAYQELRDYIADLKSLTYHYDFRENILLSVEGLEPESYIVTTNEIFTFTNHLGQEIDYDRIKEYILIESGDTYRIMDINYVETKREY